MLINSRFSPLFWLQFFGALNDNLLKNALVVIIAYKSLFFWSASSEQLVSIATAIFVLSFFFFSGWAGEVAEKLEKRKLAIWSKALELLIVIIASYSFISESYKTLFVLLFLMGIQSTLFGPIKYSLLPELLPKHQLISGNAYIQLGTNLAILLGMIIGGIVILLPAGDIWTSLLLSIFAFLGLWRAFDLPTTKSANPHVRISKNPVTPSFKICALAWRNQKARSAIFGISFFWFLGAALLNILPIYVRDHLCADNVVYSFFMGIFCTGIGIGSMMTKKVCRDRVEKSLIFWGVLGMGFSMYCLSLFPAFEQRNELLNFKEYFFHDHSFWITFFQLLFAIFGGLFIVPLYSLMIEHSKSSERSRMVAANNILNSLAIILASLMTILFFAWSFSTPMMLKIMSGTFFVVAFFLLFRLRVPVVHSCAKIFVTILYRFSVRGAFPKHSQGMIIICNHLSFLDWMFLLAESKRKIHFVIDHTYYYHRVFHRILKYYGMIPIARGSENRKVLISSMTMIHEALEENEWVCIFPEGALSPDGKMQMFQSGVKKVLKRQNVPVIPCALNGLYESTLSRHEGKVFWRFPKFRISVQLSIGEPFNYTDDIDLESKVRSLL